jgi:hypothetical protein
MNRLTVQLIVEKLDTKAISLKEAKERAARFGLPVAGRTREEFIRGLLRALAK